jgi:hypothetical protein
MTNMNLSVPVILLIFGIGLYIGGAIVHFYGINSKNKNDSK